MHNLTFEYILLAFLGMIIHITMKVISRPDKTQPVSVVKFIQNPINWVRMILTLSSAIAIIMMMDDIAKLMNVDLENGVTAKRVVSFLAGYSNHSLIRNVMKMFKKK